MGVPLMLPVVGSKYRPSGRLGTTVSVYSAPKMTGVSTVISALFSSVTLADG